MISQKYMYKVNYPFYEEELCVLEIKSLFNHKLDEKIFFSDININPSISPFLKVRLEIMICGETFEDIFDYIVDSKITARDFLVKYLRLNVEDPSFERRRQVCKELGLNISGKSTFSNPKITYGITCYNELWYFGELIESDMGWKAHNEKPNTYSSSLGINLAKSLVNIAGNNDRTKRLVDPCCGVGTVLLEGYFAGYPIKGWEINEKIADDARGNIRHFSYDIEVNTGDIKDIKDIIETFDTSIIDLPYGNFSLANDEEQLAIIRNAMRISNKVVIVSSKDIKDSLISEGLELIDECKVGKNRISEFSRYVWVCHVVK